MHEKVRGLLRVEIFFFTFRIEIVLFMIFQICVVTLEKNQHLKILLNDLNNLQHFISFKKTQFLTL